MLILIQCYVDYECDVVTMFALAGHLGSCPACREELETLRALKAAVRRCTGAAESPVWH